MPLSLASLMSPVDTPPHGLGGSVNDFVAAAAQAQEQPTTTRRPGGRAEGPGRLIVQDTPAVLDARFAPTASSLPSSPMATSGQASTVPPSMSSGSVLAALSTYAGPPAHASSMPKATLTPSQVAKGKQRALPPDTLRASSPAPIAGKQRKSASQRLADEAASFLPSPTVASAAASSSAAPGKPARARRTAALSSNAGLKNVTSHAEKMEIHALIRDCRDRMYEEATTQRYPGIFLSNRPRAAFNAVPYVGKPLVPVEPVDPPPAAASTEPAAASSVPSPVQIPVPSPVEHIPTPSFRLITDADDPRPSSSSSSSRTLRRPPPPPPQDMSDEYFVRLHRRYETFEKKLKIRERETMRHGRYKLKERMDLIRSMDPRSFASLVGTLDDRDGEADDAAASHVVIDSENVRDRMMEEAEELLRKYDLMLPSERARQAHLKKVEALEDSENDSGTSPPVSLTPSSNARPLSLSIADAPSPLSSFTAHPKAHIRPLVPAPSASAATPTTATHKPSPLSIKIRLPPSSGRSSALSTPPASEDVNGSSSSSLAIKDRSARASIAGLDDDVHKAYNYHARKRPATADDIPSYPLSAPLPAKKITLRASKRSKTAHDGAQIAPAPPLQAYVPYQYVEYYIQPPERYSDQAALVQEALKRVPEIEAAERKREAEAAVAAAAATDTAPLAPAATPAPLAVASLGPSLPSAPAHLPPTSSAPPLATPARPAPTTIDSPAVLDTSPSAPPPLPLAALPFLNAALPTPPRPTAPARRGIKSGPTLAASRGARHFLPFGVPPPRMLEFKNDFALDGEFWTLSLAEREARRAHAEDGDL